MSNNNKIRLQLWLGIGMWLYVMAIVGWFFIDDEVSRFDYFMRSVLAFIFAVRATYAIYEWKKLRQRS
ncbi:MAG: hypothetical protein IT252_05390 [Chitinophagaceae bacterium]|nr:hypothetical protein [Chitinophagaceae bacterium]